MTMDTTTMTTEQAEAFLTRLAKSNPNAYECLRLVDGDTAELVVADVQRIADGERDALLAECLDGVEGQDVINGWTDYVFELAVWASDGVPQIEER
jgi:hypothetical protein